MILIADSGSSKCDWVLCDANKNELRRIRTKGLNPNILTVNQLHKVLNKGNKFSFCNNEVKQIFFFGAGCGTQANKQKITKILSACFYKAAITVEEDTMAAIWSVNKEPSIVCILGTGSNCCYFDGNKTHTKIPSLGYIVMDEASGNFLGKELLRSYYYKQMPLELQLSFKENYSLNPKKVVKKLYDSKTPNKYLSKFARFVFENIEHPFIEGLLRQSICLFINNHVLLYADELNTSVPIHFVGSIAYHSKDIISEELSKEGYKVSSFVRRPMEKIIDQVLNGNILEVN